MLAAADVPALSGDADMTWVNLVRDQATCDALIVTMPVLKGQCFPAVDVVLRPANKLIIAARVVVVSTAKREERIVSLVAGKQVNVHFELEGEAKAVKVTPLMAAPGDTASDGTVSGFSLNPLMNTVRDSSR